ncbi:MAG: class D sortase [Candidatus Promineofilum sp.]|uniref:sortase n=1 Tax=Promineifilum sp. TaxID=2664178 RepID=UPI002411F3B3|nr:class D sortase [Promineifilum sp.]MCO5181904.1 sortase [Promineifilum sp.]
MARQKSPEELSAAELERLLYARRHMEREQRLRRAQAEGRIVVPDPGRDAAGDLPAVPPVEAALPAVPRRSFWRWLADRGLLLIEVAAAVALLTIVGSLWATNNRLNRELAAVQATQSQALALPTATATPAIGVVLLPGGHRPPVDGQAPQPGEAGGIPEHLLPIVNAYVPPPIPTPGPETPRRLEIPTLNGDYPIVQGDDWEQLKQGIGQYVGSGRPGRSGNVVLSGHNDIYGEPFRYLDRLKPGDEIIVSTERQAYTYVVSEVQVVDPTDVWVMGPTDEARVTLISCYPYRVNTRRIIVFAELAPGSTDTGRAAVAAAPTR